MSNWKPHIVTECHAPALRVQAPHLMGEPLGPTAALHAALDLARRVDQAYGEDTAAMQLQVVEPILAGSYVLVSEQRASGQWEPVGWLAYALFDADAERRHVNDAAQPLTPIDWGRGDRPWIVHWIAARGQTRRLLSVLRRLFRHWTARSLDRRAQRIVVWRGHHCSTQEASSFWLQRSALTFDSTPEIARGFSEKLSLEHGAR